MSEDFVESSETNENIDNHNDCPAPAKPVAESCVEGLESPVESTDNQKNKRDLVKHFFLLANKLINKLELILALLMSLRSFFVHTVFRLQIPVPRRLLALDITNDE